LDDKAHLDFDLGILPHCLCSAGKAMKDLKYFFLLSRPLNVLITLIAFALAAHIAQGDLWICLADPQFWYGCVCLAVISATGYWVNDVFDFKIDRENRPRTVIVNAHLSVKKVFTAYLASLFLVAALSFWLQGITLFALNVGAIVLLFLYAWLLKRSTVVGNIVIALLTALVVYYAAVMYVPRTAIMWMIMFAFEVTFIREVVKDIEDIKGDLKFKLQTLPIRIGIEATKKVLVVAFVVLILSCYAPLLEGILRHQPINILYLVGSVLCVQIPSIVLMWRLRKAEHTADFAWQSKMLKALIFAGMVTIFLLG
jgi:4-hydroxybenzoate polyprenyltransferase